MYLAKQNHFILINSKLPVFVSFMDHAFGILPYMDHQINTHKFSSISFIVLHFAFKSMVHSEYIVVACVRTESVLFILQMVIQFFQGHLLQRQYFTHEIVFAFLEKICSLFLNFQLCSISGFCFINLQICSFNNTTLC